MKYLGALLLLANLAACGSANESAPAPAATPPEKTVFDPMTRQIDRAKQLSETLPDQRKADLDKAIDPDSQ